MDTYTIDTDIIKICMGFVVLLFIFLFVFYFEKFVEFRKEKKHIDMELSRALEDKNDAEIKHWKDEKKNLYKVFIKFTKTK